MSALTSAASSTVAGDELARQSIELFTPGP